MTVKQFQNEHSGKIKELLESPMGKEFLGSLHALRPALPESFPTEHAMTRAYAKCEGYDLCLRSIIGLAMPVKITTEPDANYGVPEKSQPKE